MGIKEDYRKRGFSLIEIVIVIGIIGLSLPLLFSVFFMLLQQQVRLFNLSETKRQGDNTMVVLQNLIRNNAVSIEDPDQPGIQVCNSAGDYYPPDFRAVCLRFLDKNNDYFTICETDDNKISSDSAATSNLLLTNERTTTDQTFTISCSRKSSFSTPLVNIGFTIKSADKTVSLNYRTSIKMKNY